MTVSESDVQLATRLATGAGLLLVELRARLHAEGAPDRSVMDAGDAAAQRYLASELHAARPEDAVLSEEGAEDPRRFTHDRAWIIDPLDGTREYGEAGRSDWAVHVAVWDHGSLTAGAVALPDVGLTLATDPPPERPDVPRRRPLMVTSRSRVTPLTAVVAEAIGADVTLGVSSGAKAMAVVTGHADAYVHAGGMYQWDSAAPAAVALAAGLHVSRVDGSPIIYNERDPWLPDLVICRPDLAEPILAAVAQAQRAWFGAGGSRRR